MNDTNSQITQNVNTPQLIRGICELCAQKDQEDIYIIFDILYRVFMLESFHQGPSINELYYEQNMNTEEPKSQENKESTEDNKNQNKKIYMFSSKLSDKLLSNTFSSPAFRELMQEIFRIKYPKLGDFACDHNMLVDEYKKLVGPFEESVSNENSFDIESQEKFHQLEESVKEVKMKIASCHAEIKELSTHVANRLFDPRSQIQRKETNEEESKMDSGENGSSGDGKDSSEEKFKGNRTIRKSVSNNVGDSSGSHFSGNNGISGRHENGHDGNSSNGNVSGNARASSDQSDTNGMNSTKKTKQNYMVSKSKLPKKATNILKSWFLENIQNPYPNYEAKELLSRATGLSKKQIQNWFTNSRKRFLEPLRKKLNSNQDINIRDMNSPVRSRFNSEKTNDNKKEEFRTNGNIMYAQGESRIPQYIQAPFQQIHQPQPQLHTQPQPNVAFVSPNYTQPVIYQATMATNPNGGNFMILTPCVIQNPIVTYSYRPVQNILPVNNNFIQIQPNPVQVINPSYIEQPYMMPIQASMMDFRNVVTQNLSTNYNTINNNVYNSISEETVPVNNNINSNLAGFDQEKNSGVIHSRPEHEIDQNEAKKNILLEDEKK